MSKKTGDLFKKPEEIIIEEEVIITEEEAEEAKEESHSPQKRSRDDQSSDNDDSDDMSERPEIVIDQNPVHISTPTKPAAEHPLPSNPAAGPKDKSRFRRWKFQKLNQNSILGAQPIKKTREVGAQPIKKTREGRNFWLQFKTEPGQQTERQLPQDQAQPLQPQAPNPVVASTPASQQPAWVEKAKRGRPPKRRIKALQDQESGDNLGPASQTKAASLDSTFPAPAPLPAPNPLSKARLPSPLATASSTPEPQAQPLQPERTPAATEPIASQTPGQANTAARSGRRKTAAQTPQSQTPNPITESATPTQQSTWAATDPRNSSALEQQMMRIPQQTLPVTPFQPEQSSPQQFALTSATSDSIPSPFPAPRTLPLASNFPAPAPFPTPAYAPSPSATHNSTPATFATGRATQHDLSQASPAFAMSMPAPQITTFYQSEFLSLQSYLIGLQMSLLENTRIFEAQRFKLLQDEVILKAQQSQLLQDRIDLEAQRSKLLQDEAILKAQQIQLSKDRGALQERDMALAFQEAAQQILNRPEAVSDLQLPGYDPSVSLPPSRQDDFLSMMEAPPSIPAQPLQGAADDSSLTAGTKVENRPDCFFGTKLQDNEGREGQEL